MNHHTSLENSRWLPAENRNFINDHLVLTIHKIEKILTVDHVQFSGSLRTWRIVIDR